MDVYEWVELGVERGFCSKAVCSTHEGLPRTTEEADYEEEGGDPCIHAVRLIHPGEVLEA